MKKYVVRPNDNLWTIAEAELKDGMRWVELARLNNLEEPYELEIGQVLLLPDRPAAMQRGPAVRPTRAPYAGATATVSPSSKKADTMPGRAFFFIISDEVLPSAKVVRKVLSVPLDNAQFIEANPELFGIKPKAPGANVSIGEHALGQNRSPYISASNKPHGAPNISGRPVYIDVNKAKAAGVKFHTPEEIIADLDRLAQEQPASKARIDKLKNVIKNVEGEVLLEGEVPKGAVKSVNTMRVTRGLRVVQGVGVILTVRDMGQAAVKSVEQGSPKPVVAESIRQAGGWAAGVAGFKFGGIAGAAVGIKTGPGALLTGFAGGLIFGAAGYWGADWVADFIDDNEK